MRGLVASLLLVTVLGAGCTVHVEPLCGEAASAVTMPRLSEVFQTSEGGQGAWQGVALVRQEPGERLVQRDAERDLLLREEANVRLLGDANASRASGAATAWTSLAALGSPDLASPRDVTVHAYPAGETGCDPRMLASASVQAFGGPVRTAEAGKGVHVWTAGFFPNGTLFYTNVAELDASEWPRWTEYAWEGGDPLAVYVYEAEPADRPAWWADPQAGTPLEGTIPGFGYSPTIRGFNDALKGLSTATTVVAELAPEDAYTRPGYEDHPLYGESLVFLIRLQDVVDVPCPAQVDPMACGLAIPR